MSILSSSSLPRPSLLPPSSTLTGAEGTLSWQVSQTGQQVLIEGSSPKWTVRHTAHPDLRPIRTEHDNPDGTTVIVEYAADRATVRLPERVIVHEQAGLWDADTLDVRLGARVAAGKPEQRFSAVDTGSGKVYSFDSQLVGEERCGAAACTHVQVQLTGLLRLVGPTWSYWYGTDGELLSFEGPAGSFKASEAR